jgi:WD40 repeat protein
MRHQMTTAAMPPQTLGRTKVYGEPQLHTDGEVLALAFAADGSLWSIEDPGVLRHWNAQTGQQLHWHSLSDLETLWFFSDDASVIVSASDDLTFWDTSSGQVLTAIKQPSWVSAMACHPDSAHVATGHDDGSIHFWNASGHQLLHQLSGSPASVSALAFSRDGKILAAAHEDCVITLWDFSTGKSLGKLVGHTDRIPALAWHAAGHFLVSAGWDRTARVWDVHTLQPVVLLNNHAAQVTTLAMSRDGSLLATADSALAVHVWDFASKKELHELKGPQSEIFALAFSRDGKRLACGGDHVIHMWDSQTGRTLAASHAKQVDKTTLSVSPDGTRLATNGGGLAPRVWNLAMYQPELVLEEKLAVHEVAYSPAGALLAGACEKHVRIWQTRSGAVTLDLDGPDDPTTTLAFSPDGALLAGASSTGLSVWLWRVADGEPVLLIPDALDGCAVQTLAFHPKLPLLAVGGIDWLATGGSNGAISLWDHVKRHEVATFPEGTMSLAFHPDGQRLASTTLDNSICIWDLVNRKILAELTGHDGPVTCVAYSPDGKWLASGGEDRTIRLWNDAGEECACREIDSQPSSLCFSPDGQLLYSANANTTCYQIKVADIFQN